MPFETRAEILDVYRSTPTTLRALLRDLPDALARQRGAGAEAWSIVEVVCHLRDAEVRALERVRRMRDEERPRLAAYDQAALAAEEGYQEQSLPAALAAFERARAEHVATLEALDPAGWERVGLHEEVGEISITDLAAHMAAHDAVHLAQIARRILAG